MSACAVVSDAARLPRARGGSAGPTIRCGVFAAERGRVAPLPPSSVALRAPAPRFSARRVDGGFSAPAGARSPGDRPRTAAIGSARTRAAGRYGTSARSERRMPTRHLRWGQPAERPRSAHPLGSENAECAEQVGAAHRHRVHAGRIRRRLSCFAIASSGIARTQGGSRAGAPPTAGGSRRRRRERPRAPVRFGRRGKERHTQPGRKRARA